MSQTRTPTPQDAWMLQVLGIDPCARAVPLAGPGDSAAAWTAARKVVVASLDQLAKAIDGLKDPLGFKAIILVKSIAKNLTALPASRQQVDELRRYLHTDSVIDDAELPNGFGIKVSIRAPLLAALDGVERGLPAA